MDTGHFQMALKGEIEEISSLQRKQNIENLTLLKGLSSTMKNLKDSYKYFKSNDHQVKELMLQVVNYFSFINQILNVQGGVANDEIIDYKVLTPNNVSKSALF